MKKILVLMLLLSVIVSAKENKYGKEITLKDKVSITKVLEKPSKFEGKTILVEGKILDVCPDSGCWIELGGEKAGQKIKVQFEEGKVSIPKDSKGKTVTVQGVLQEATSEASSCSEGDHAKSSKVVVKDGDKGGCGGCESEGSCGDEGSCGGDEKVSKNYEIKGLGAVIK